MKNISIETRVLETPFPHLQRPPKQLWVRGQPEAFALLDRLPEHGFAVVGTRRPQPRSTMHTREVIHRLRLSPLIILSGLARGIDTTAHEAALEAGLPTVAILGSALDSIYPRENAALAQRILEARGLLISETPPGGPTEKWNFILRNRIIAGLSKATWMVAAADRSGALNTADWAIEHGKDLYVTPCFPGDVALAGNERLLTQATAYPLWHATDLGHSWTELATQIDLPLLAPPLYKLNSPDTEDLMRIVTERTAQSGGTSLEGLMEWATDQNWGPQRLFDAVRCALQSECLVQQGPLFFPQSRR